MPLRFHPKTRNSPKTTGKEPPKKLDTTNLGPALSFLNLVQIVPQGPIHVTILVVGVLREKDVTGHRDLALTQYKICTLDTV